YPQCILPLTHFSYHAPSTTELYTLSLHDALPILAQFVQTESDPTATQTYGARYIFGTLDQTSISLDTRLNWPFSPKLSLQLYLQPFVVSGSSRDLKELRQPRTYEFDVHGKHTGTS